MTISADVKSQLFRGDAQDQLIRLPLEADVYMEKANTSASSSSNARAWTHAEHERFLRGLELFPSGPWKEVAAYVATRTTRQTMTHAQKYREKIARRKRGLRSAPFVRAERKQQEQNEAVAADSAIPSDEDASETEKEAMQSPTATDEAPRLDDPLDFHGCFSMFDAVEPMPFHSAAQHMQFTQSSHAELVALLAECSPLLDLPLDISSECETVSMPCAELSSMDF